MEVGGKPQPCRRAGGVEVRAGGWRDLALREPAAVDKWDRADEGGSEWWSRC
jgi:hypothetical protein